MRKKSLRVQKKVFVLLAILLIAFLLRFPSLFEPNWYGDEGIYQVIGRAIRRGELIYRDIWDNKPPALYLIYALVNGEQFLARALSLVFLLASIPAFFLLAQRLFTKNLSVFLATALFAVLFSLPLLEGNIANAENFMLLPIILSALLVLSSPLQPKPSTLLFAGLLLSFAFLVKIVAIFDFSAFLLFLFFLNTGRKKLAPLIFGFLLPILTVVLFFLSQNTFSDFMMSTFSQNVGYVAHDLLILKLLSLLIFVALLFRNRDTMKREETFILLWLAFSLFNAFFAGRPYTHYLLVLLPSFCLLAGSIFAGREYRLMHIIIIIVLLYLLPKHFWIYGKPLSYYQNFLTFLRGGQTISSYQSFFAYHVERDYMLAQFLRAKTKPSDSIFIWGDNPQIYVLSDKLPVGRFTVAYHITAHPRGRGETAEAIANKRPRYIVVVKQEDSYEEFLAGYRLVASIAGSQVYERSTLLP